MVDIDDDYTVCAGDDRELGAVHRAIERINGWLIVQPRAIFDAPKLSRVDGCLLIKAGAQIHVPNLAAVGDLHVGTAETAFPKLVRVRGFLEAEPGAVVDAPALTRVERLRVGTDAMVRAPALATPGQSLHVATGGTLVGPGGVHAQPGDTWSRFRRRVLSATATAPHGRCARRAACAEHERDRRVPSCKRRNRFQKEPC